MLKIGIGLSFYNDFDSMQRMLQSLQSYPIDYIIAVDGRYKGHTSSKPLSDKKTRDLFKTIQKPYTIIDAPDISQIEKRQIYFDKSADYDLDIIIVLDSDEHIIHDKTNWPLFIEELNNLIKANRSTYIQGYSIPLFLQQKDNPPDYCVNSARLFHRPYELRYLATHFDVRNKNTGVNMMYQTNTTKLEHLVIGTDHKLRTKEYMIQHDQYEQWQQTNEESQDSQKQRIDVFIANKNAKQTEIHA